MVVRVQVVGVIVQQGAREQLWLVGVALSRPIPSALSTGPDPSPALVASTMGSVLIRYFLQLPPTGERISEPSIAMLAGKDYALLHGAPVVGVFVLDHAGLPIPSVYEQDNQMAPGGYSDEGACCTWHPALPPPSVQLQRWPPHTLR